MAPSLPGAELANVLNEAALEAVRRRADRVARADIYNGMDRILQVSARLPDQAVTLLTIVGYLQLSANPIKYIQICSMLHIVYIIYYYKGAESVYRPGA